MTVLRRQEQLRNALASRDVIGQAKGVIMERYRLDAVHAFELLKQLSQRSNIKLVEVARGLIDAELSRTTPPNAAAPAPGQRAFLADIRAAGLGNSNGGLEALDQGWDMCGLMDAGLSRQKMVSQFAALNPALGPGGAAQVVGIAIRDLCPWYS